MPVDPPPAAPAFVFVEATVDLGLAGLPDARLGLTDLNDDGRPDLVVSRRSVFLNVPDASAPRGWRFQRAPDSLPDLGKGAVSAFANFDNDGQVDAILARDADPSSAEPAMVFCRGRGDGTFEEPVPIAGLANAHTAALAVGDVNGDGLLDFYRGNWYRKYGESLDAPAGDLMVQVAPATRPPAWRRAPLPEDGVAFDESRDAGGRPTYGAMIAHLGAPTVVGDRVCVAQLNYGRRWNRLDVWDSAHSVWQDVAPATGFDGDGDRSGAYPAWLLERARTDKRFPSEPEKPFRSNGNTFDMAVADVDGDGLFDAFVAEITHAWAGPSADRSRFLLARMADTPIGVRFETPAWASVDRVPPPGDARERSWNQGDLFCELGDLDNDGRIDLVLASGDYPDAPPLDQRLRLFRQVPETGADGRRFVDATSGSGIDLHGAAQLALGDLDGDGDLDIVCGQSFTRFTPEQVKAEGGVPHLRVWLNQAVERGSPGTTLTLRGEPSQGVPRDATGAVVFARTPGGAIGGRTVIAQLHGTGGHSGHQSAMQVHFGGTGASTVFTASKGASVSSKRGPGAVESTAGADVMKVDAPPLSASKGSKDPAVAPEGPSKAAPVDVFVGRTDGHAVYRIPSILRLADGMLLAFAEARDSKSDNGSNDIVLRRSEDGGATWEPMQTVLDLPGRSLNNPCAVQVSRGAHEGRVLLMFQSYPTGCGEGCVKPGTDPANACLTLLVHSDDGGRNWSAPRDVTSSVKRGAPVTSVATGPGVGIQLSHGASAGRILMPFNQGPPGDWRVYAVHSDDGGDTWSMGSVAPEDGHGHANEVQFAERTDGTVLLVARGFGGATQRRMAASSDGGETWTMLKNAPDLVDPSCMGGLISLTGSDRDRMVCTGPGSRAKRVAGRAWFSADGGRSWARSLPIADGFFAYSVPVQLGADRIGVLFERDDYARISFVTLPIPEP